LSLSIISTLHQELLIIIRQKIKNKHLLSIINFEI
jgi:hypothetical protein